MNILLASLVAFMLGLLIGLFLWNKGRSRSERETSELRLQITSLEKERESDAEKLDWVKKAEGNMRDAFKALAGDVLKSNSETLTSQAKKDIKGIVDPLKENLLSLDGHVRDRGRGGQGGVRGRSDGRGSGLRGHFLGGHSGAAGQCESAQGPESGHRRLRHTGPFRG